ncbi:uncharacterized protein LOC134857004 [Symsagittifera roscoffensis]|uniref:uncharacterized protein LOC134857004 n=1 Tax=Symsagittifera roscoffensis TaxID=84072 RepID=UPI00307C8BF9
MYLICFNFSLVVVFCLIIFHQTFTQDVSFNWSANAAVPSLRDYFFNPPESYEPHPAIGGIQCYRRKCRPDASNGGTCPGVYDDRVRGNFCVVKNEFGYLMFDGVFSVFDLTSACYDKVKACHVSYCNSNEFYRDKTGWCRCEDRQCILKMLLQPPNIEKEGSKFYYKTPQGQLKRGQHDCKDTCHNQRHSSLIL